MHMYITAKLGTESLISTQWSNVKCMNNYNMQTNEKIEAKLDFLNHSQMHH